MIPKTYESCAMAINDHAEFMISTGCNKNIFIKHGGTSSPHYKDYTFNNNRMWWNGNVFSLQNDSAEMNITALINNAVLQDRDSILMKMMDITDVNDLGMIIANAETIYGEMHAIPIHPLNSN